MRVVDYVVIIYEEMECVVSKFQLDSIDNWNPSMKIAGWTRAPILDEIRKEVDVVSDQVNSRCRDDNVD